MEISSHTHTSNAKPFSDTSVLAFIRNIVCSFIHPFNHSCCQCWGKLLLKVMHYNIALLPKKVTNYVT